MVRLDLNRQIEEPSAVKNVGQIWLTLIRKESNRGRQIGSTAQIGSRGAKVLRYVGPGS